MIDLIVDFTRRTSLLDLVRIERELSEALDRKVDLLTERALSPYLRGQILEESRVIYERAALRRGVWERHDSRTPTDRP